MAGSGKPRCPGLLGETDESVKTNLRVSKPEPGWPDERANAREPTCTRSDTAATGPGRASERVAIAAPRLTGSSTGRGGPTQVLPDMDEAKSTCAELCKSAKGPGCRESGTSTKGSKHVEDCVDKVRPVLTRSGASRIDSILTQPTTGMASWRYPLGNFTSPNTDDKGPMRHQARSSAVKPKCKESRTNDKGSIREGLRGNSALPESW